MKVSSKIFLAITAAAALSVARPAFGNLMINGDVHAGNFADQTLTIDVGMNWMPNGSDDVARLNWRNDIQRLLIMRNQLRDALVRPSLDPINVLPAPGGPPGVSVPDGGSTLLLLGLAFLGLAALRPRLSF